jgi:hypothetical protein
VRRFGAACKHGQVIGGRCGVVNASHEVFDVDSGLLWRFLPDQVDGAGPVGFSVAWLAECDDAVKARGTPGRWGRAH